jgi:Ring finger domain/IQ calmodulin-binding motif
MKPSSKPPLPGATSSKAVVDSAALQSHLLGSLKLDFSTPGRALPSANLKQPSSTPTGNTGCSRSSTPSSVASTRSNASSVRSGGSGLGAGSVPASKATSATVPSTAVKPAPTPTLTALKPAALVRTIADKWECECGYDNNPSSSACCRDCGAERAKDVKAKAPTLSLAQMRGLVAAPPPLLTAKEWAELEKKAQRRLFAEQNKGKNGATAEKKDGTHGEHDEDEEEEVLHAGAAGGVAQQEQGQDCAICMESLVSLREAVILSCSHLLHHSCLASFERFQKQQHHSRDTEVPFQPACPLCRSQGYQKKRTRIGAKCYILRCAVKVQSAWRGYVTRKLFWKKRKAFWGSVNGAKEGAEGKTLMTGDDLRRRKRVFASDLMAEVSSRFDASQAQRGKQVDSLLRESDDKVEEARRMMALMEKRMEERRRARGSSGGASTASTEASSATPASLPAGGGSISGPIFSSSGAADPAAEAAALLDSYASRLEAALRAERERPPVVSVETSSAAKAAADELSVLASLTPADVARARTKALGKLFTAEILSDATEKKEDDEGEEEEEEVCPICIMPLVEGHQHLPATSKANLRLLLASLLGPAKGVAGAGAVPTSGLSVAQERASTALLSALVNKVTLLIPCGHFLHKSCLASLERFNSGGSDNTAVASAVTATGGVPHPLASCPGVDASSLPVMRSDGTWVAPTAGKGKKNCCPVCRGPYCKATVL